MRFSRRSGVSKAVAGGVIVIIVLAAVVGIVEFSGLLSPSSTTTTNTTSSTTSTTSTTSGTPVPNPGVFIEENPIEPGPGGLDPALTWDFSDVFFLNVYENLLWFNGSDPTTFVPWLAQSYTVSPNGTQYTFQLRQGITFQDGTPFNASAVKFSYDRAVLINHADGPEFLLSSPLLLGIRGAPEYSTANGTTEATNMTAAQAYLNAGGVRVLGTYTVQFNLEQPFAGALGVFAWESGGSIVSPSYVIKNCPGTSVTPGVTPGIECTWMQTHMMGTGPFMLKQYTPKSQIDFVRYDNYWGTPSNTGPAKLKEYIVKDVQEVGTRELDLLSGAADAISLPASNAFDLINQQVYQANQTVVSTKNGVRIWTAPTNAIAHLLLDPRFPPLDNIKFRQALAYAFPYQQFIENVSNGFAIKLNNEISPHMFGFNASLQGYDYNPTLAKQLFDQVGFSGTIQLTVSTGDATSIGAVLLLKSSVESLDPNIHISINQVDVATGLTMFHQFQLPIIAQCCWVPDIADGSETLANWATPEGFYGKTTQFNNATVTQWLNEAASSSNRTLRAQLYSQVQQAMLAYAGIIPLYAPVAIQAERTWVLPSSSPIGRALYNAQYGDGSGGVEGGYIAYYINKANTTQTAVALSATPSVGTGGLSITQFGLPALITFTALISVSFAGRTDRTDERDVRSRTD